ncbi:MAG TPA: hypothetical protein VFB59_00115, partial [Candidatus Saccharimonadales bacterium]|nr:hypothetical protein [Candidatus Saccharimonadales bacterium]
DALNVSNSTSTGNIAVFSDNSTAVLTLANGGGALFRNQTNSATALQVQNATGADTLFTIDTAARSASGGNLVKIGNSTGTDTDTTFLVLDGSTADPSTNIAALNGGMFYDSDDHKVKLIENGQVKIICNTTDLGCGTGTVTLQSAYGNGNTINTTDNRNIAFNLTDQSTDPSFLIDLQCDTSCSTNGKFAVQDDGSDVFTILPAAGGITVGDNTLNTPVTINSGTGTIAVGTGAQARTVNVATGAAVQTVTVGSTNSTSSLLLQAGTGNLQIQTQGGTLGVGNNSVAQTLQIGNTTGATAITIDAGTGTIAVGTGAQARTINVGTGAAAQTVTVGSTSGASALTLQSGTGNLSITTQGTGSLNIGNNAVAQTLNIGNGTGATAVSVLCGTGTCGFGNNAVAHTTTLGSTTGTATTNLQAGTGGLSLTSGANITLGTSNTTGTLLVLDDKTDSGDPTGVAGGMYYNSNLKVFRCYDTYWRDCMATVRTTYSYTMEMGSGTGDNTFTFDTSGGGTDDGVDGVTSHPSIMLMGTSTGATNWVYAGSRKSDAIRLGNGDYWRYETVFRIGTISDDTTDYFFRAGFGDNLVASDNGSNGCYFKYNDDVNGGDWQGICVSGGTANNTVCDTNVPVSASTWYRLTVAVNSAGNSVDFIIDGTSRCQVTTNIPTGSGNVVGWGDAIKKTTGSTDITADLDYITLEGQMGTSR